MKKQILSIILAVCTVFAMLPITVFAEGPAVYYNIWVGRTMVTSENAGNVTGDGISGTVTYDADTNTLTLDNATISSVCPEGTYIDSYGDRGGIFAPLSDLNIVLVGTNKIDISGNSDIRYPYGIKAVSRGLSIKGSTEDASLTVAGAPGLYESSGIMGQTVKIENCTVNAASGDSGGASIGMSANGISILNATVTATSGAASASGFGIISNGSLSIENSTVTATGKTDSGETTSGILAGDISIFNSTVTANGGAGDGASNIGLNSFGGVTLTASTLTATGGTAVQTASGLTCGDGAVVSASEDIGGTSPVIITAEAISSVNSYKYVQVIPGSNPESEARWGMSGSGGTQPTHWTSGTLADAMTYANSLDSGTAYIQLLKGVATTGTLEFVAGKTTILDLNDQPINAYQGDFSVLTVRGNLTLKDTGTGGAGIITGGKVITNTGGNQYCGGGVSVLAGSLTMTGGKITGNTAENGGGGGVCMREGGTFTMTGGEISGNTSNFAGGVFAYAGKATVGGTAKITGNHAGIGSNLTVSNVYLNVYVNLGFCQTIAISTADPLADGAYIGVATEIKPISSAPFNITDANSSDVSKYFHSDDSAYCIQNSANNVAQLAAPTPPHITTPSLPNGLVGTAYNQTLAATGTTPITWSVESGTLPAGLSLDTGSGAITGTPTAAGTSSFTIKAENGITPDDTKTLSLTIKPAATTPSKVWDGTTANYFDGGTGTKADPYRIATAEQLKLLSAVMNGRRAYWVVKDQGTKGYDYLQKANYILTADIVLNDTSNWTTWSSTNKPKYSWIPISIYYNVNKVPVNFAGTFDGDGHTIAGIYQQVQNDSSYDVGLFAAVNGGIVKNVNVIDSYVSGIGASGGVVGRLEDGQVINCTNSGSVSGGEYMNGVGGVVGGAVGSSLIENCQNSGTITEANNGYSYIGGIVGAIRDSTILRNCKNFGAVSGSSRVGGVLGGVYDYAQVNVQVVNCQSPKGLTSKATGDIGESGKPGGGDEYIGHLIGYYGNGINSGNISEPIELGVTVLPASWTCLPAGGSQTFTATVEGDDTNSVTWSIMGGDSSISVDPDGKVTVASGATDGKIYVVKATSTADSTKFAMANVIISTPTFAVSYNVNGGTGSVPTDTTAYKSGSTVTVNFDTVPTRMGYTFEGWSLTSDAATAAYTASGTQTFSITAAITLYAVWTPINYSISYTLNDGVVEPANPTGYNAEAADFTLNNPTRIGYTFKGWSGTGLTGDANTSVIVNKGSTGNRTYTANWTADSYTLTYDYQGATGGNANAGKTVTYASAIGTLPEPDKTGYNFDGWYTEATGGTLVTAATVYQTAAAGTIYAHWTSVPTAPKITTTALPNGAVGVTYNQVLAATGTAPITWNVAGGTLPAGLSLNESTGEIGGKPTTAGTFSFTVKAENSTGSDTKELSITVASPITVTLPSGAASLDFGSAPDGYTAIASKTVTITNNGTDSITIAQPSSENYAIGALSKATLEKNETATFTVAPKTGLEAKKYDTSIAVKAGAYTYGSVAVTFTVTAPVPTKPTITTNTLPDGTVGTAYSQTLTATGTAPITWNVAGGTLPAGLHLNTSTGEIGGTPTTAGTFSFTVKAENNTGSDTQELSITVTSPITSVSVTPAAATVEKSKTRQFTATVNGTAADKSVTWSVSGGTKSTIDQSGLLSVAAGETAAILSVKATSTIDGSKYGTATVMVSEPKAEARWGMAGTGDAQPADWASGTLADAMAYANGLTSGTAYIQLLGNVATTATLEFKTGKTTVLDLNGKTIDGENNSSGPVIYIGGNLTLTDMNAGVQGKITGGKAGYFESGNGGGVFVGGAYMNGDILPGSFTMKGGIITGNDTSGKGSSSAGGGVMVSGGSFTMEGGAITGNTANSGGGVLVGANGSFTMSGGSITKNIANYKWGGGVNVNSNGTMTVGGTANISDNHIGAGTNAPVSNVYLDRDYDGNPITISVSATVPPAEGASVSVTTATKPISNIPVNVTGTNSSDISKYFHSDDSAYSIRNGADNVVQLAVTPTAPSAPIIITTRLSDGGVGTAYSQTLEATGTAPITWNVAGGTLPAGLSLNESTGEIGGKPTTAGTFSFTVKAENSTGSDTKELSITVASPITVTLPSGAASLDFGSAPDGYTAIASKTVTITNNGTDSITIAQPSSENYAIGALSKATLEKNETATFTVAPKTGLEAKKYDTSIAVKAGAYTYGSVAVTFTVTAPVPTKPTITTNTLPDGTVGTAYSQTLTATGTAPITWNVAGGILPAGLHLNTSTGEIGGKPTTAGTFSFTVKAENSTGSDTKELSITVTSPITSVSVSPATATVKKTKTRQFTATVTGTAADKSVTWSVNGGTKSSIDQNGLLTVGAMETAATLTVTATSTTDTSKFGTAAVTVTAAPKLCTVTFDSDGGSAVDPVSGVEEGKTITLPNAPTKDNCRFDGWYTEKNGGGTPFTGNTIVSNSITVHAKWTKLVTVAGIVVNYDDTPIAGAGVTLNPNYGTFVQVTDAQGRFSFGSIPEDVFTATAKFSDDSTVLVNVNGNYGNVKIVKPKPYITITTQPQDAVLVKIPGQSAVFTVQGTRTPSIKDSIGYRWYWLKGVTPDTLTDTAMTGRGSQMTINQDNNNVPGRGTYKLYAYAFDSEALIEAYSRVATLKVAGTSTIAGTVKNANGDAIQGATVKLVYAGGAWPYGTVAMTSGTNPQTTGADGRYQFLLVPDGKYTLVITLPNGGGVITSGPYDFPGVNPPADPATPIDPGVIIPDRAVIQVNGQPQDAAVKNGRLITLNVDAASTDGTELNFQWYSSSKNSNSGGTVISAATAKTYTPPTEDKGTTYYYCVVSGGSLTAVTTRAAKVTVFTYGVIQGTVLTTDKQPIEGAKVELICLDTPAPSQITTSTNPQTTLGDGKYKFAEVPDGKYQLKITLPDTDGQSFVVAPINVPNVNPDIPVTPPDRPAISITGQPGSLTVALNDTAEFTVAAGVSTGEKVLYQWYRNTVNSTTGGIAINGAIGGSYSASTATKGVTYYYCVINANGAQAVTSNIARLTVRNTPLGNLMTIEGDVVDESIKVQGAEVTLSPKAGTSQNPQTTGSNGHYRFENLTDGKYAVTVKLPDGGVIEKEIIIEDGEITPIPPNNIPVPAVNSITITRQPADIEVTAEMEAGFTVKAVATKANVSYQWYKNTTNTSSGGIRLDGKTDAALTLGKQAEGVSYYYCVISSIGAADAASHAAKLTVTKAGGNKGDLEGGIVDDDDGKPVAGASVKLMKNGTDGTQFGATVTTSEDGKFRFIAIPYGSYSLVAQMDASTVTRQITVKSASTAETLILPGGAKNTKVVIEGGNTPSAAVENLEAMFTGTDSAIARQPGATVEIMLVVKKQDDPSGKEDIDAALGTNHKVGIYLDAKLVKTISGTVTDDGTENIQPLFGQALRLVIDLPEALWNKAPYQIIRSHTENGVSNVRVIIPDYDRDLQTLSFDADAFSTYAVVYTDSGSNNNNNNNDNNNGTGTSTPSGKTEIRPGPGGKADVTPGRPNPGDKVIITPKPDDGYQTKGVTVTDSNGKNITVTDNGGSYSYIQPRGDVTITVTFEKRAAAYVPMDPRLTGVAGWLETVDHIRYLSGYSNGSFGPDDDMTRAEVAQMFYNLLLNKGMKVTAAFSDVPDSAWYAKAVNTLASIGVVKGVGNNAFAPERAVTRAEFTVIAMRFAKLTPGGENKFSDVPEGAWYTDSVMDAVSYGWITGYPDGTFRPGHTITRAEVAVIVNSMLGRSADLAYLDTHRQELRQFSDLTVRHWAYDAIMEAANTHGYTVKDAVESWTGLK